MTAQDEIDSWFEREMPNAATVPPPALAPKNPGGSAAGADLGMAATDLIEDGDRPQAGGALQQRHYLALPCLAQRVRASPAARCFLL
jgi:hypothetical protein